MCYLTIFKTGIRAICIDDSLPSASSLFSKPQDLKHATKVSQSVVSKQTEPGSKQVTTTTTTATSSEWDDGDWESPLTAETETTYAVDPKAGLEWTDDKWDTADNTGWEPIHEVTSTQQGSRDKAQQREQRRLKQQAAKDKKATEPRPSKALRLGAVKKLD